MSCGPSRPSATRRIMNDPATGPFCLPASAQYQFAFSSASATKSLRVNGPEDYGQSGAPSNPVVSANPVMILAFWIACPAAPLPRLSIAANAMIGPPAPPDAAYDTNTR